MAKGPISPSGKDRNLFRKQPSSSAGLKRVSPGVYENLSTLPDRFNPHQGRDANKPGGQE